MSRGYNWRRFVVRVLVSSKLRTVISVANTIFTLGGVRLDTLHRVYHPCELQRKSRRKSLVT